MGRSRCCPRAPGPTGDAGRDCSASHFPARFLCPPPSCGSHRLGTFTGTCVSINLLKFFLGPWQIQMHKMTAVPEMTREPGI